MSVDKANGFNPLLEQPIPEASALPLAGMEGLGDGTLASFRSLKERLEQMPLLTSLDGPSEGAQLWVSADYMRIGRGENCHFALRDPAVAPYHARLLKLPGGAFQLAAMNPREAPLFVRKRGRFHAVATVPLRDGMVIRLGKNGPRLRYRFLGEPEQANGVFRLLLSVGFEEPLLSEPMLRERLVQLWRTGTLQPTERNTLQQTLRHLSPLRFYRRWFYIWAVIAIMLVFLGVSREMRLRASESEAAALRRQLAGYWPSSAGSRAAQGLRRDQATRVVEGVQSGTVVTETRPQLSTALVSSDADVQASGVRESESDPDSEAPGEASELALLQGDPLAQQVTRLMRTAGMAQPVVSLGMMRQIHSELEKEVQRIKHQFELEAFQARSARFRPRIEDILRREFQLAPMLAALAWLESDYRLDAEGGEGRLGMWQLSEEVAAEYGLITEQGEDFRMDFEASTRGSARYLSDLLTRFGVEQLPLVVVSFHLGTEVVENTIRQHKLWRQEQRSFPALLRLAGTGDAQTLSTEQLQYVSRFFAVQIIAENQAYYLSPGRP